MSMETTYLGLKLKSPIVIGASHMTGQLKTLRELENQGAGAVVIKSLFEEEIQYMNLQAKEVKEEFEERHAEMISVFPHFEDFGPERHLKFLGEVKESLQIPVIASLNCVHESVWVDYAKKIAATGIDALELNLYQTPVSLEKSGLEIEEELLAMLKKVREAVEIPISVKLSEQYTNPGNIIRRMDEIGVDGFVLFNRRFLPDVNIYDLKLKYPFNLSHAMDYRASVQMIGLLYDRVKGTLVGSNGILTANDVIRMLLVGADAVQMVSAVYKNGIPYIAEVLEEVEHWMQKQGFNTLDDLRGKLAKANVTDPLAYERSQYIDLLTNKEQLIKEFQV